MPEALLLGLHNAAYLSTVLLVLFPLKALAFVVVQQGPLGLFVGSGPRPDHKGMPILCMLRLSLRRASPILQPSAGATAA